MTRFLTCSLVALASTLLAAGASAHITLKSPAPRYDPTLLKDGPCGKLNGGKSANVTTFAPGEQITVTWEETINHPGHFRISFDDDGDDAFQDPASFDDVGSGLPILIDNIADKNGGMYSQEVTLPNIECDNCTLQVIQVMTDKPPYGDGNDLYYQCADLVLSASGSGGSSAVSTGAGGTTSTASTTGGTTDGAGVGGSGVSAGSGGSAPTSQSFASETDTGGCSVRPQGHSWLTAPILGLLAAFALRRRRSSLA